MPDVPPFILRGRLLTDLDLDRDALLTDLDRDALRILLTDFRLVRPIILYHTIDKLLQETRTR